MGDATNETFEVTLQRQGPYPAQRHGFSCQATHEAVLARAIQLHEEHLAQREVDPSSVVLRFRDQDGQLLTIHDDLNLVRAMEEARDSQGLVQLDFLLQVAPQARQQRQCRSCQQLFTSRNQLFLHLKASGHDEDLPSDEEPHESAGAGSLKNDAFCDYYRQQRIVPEELWPLAYEALKTPLPLVLRATGHALATDCEQRLAEMTELAPLPLCSHAWMLPCRLDPKVKSFIAAGQALGVWHRQEWASMLPVLALEVKPDETVLDLCASPGSKTLQLLEYQSGASVDGGLLVANELSRSRALVVAQRSRRADRRSLLVTNLDGRQFPALKTPQGRKRKFQKVLVDAPCSGDGTLRKSCGGWATWRAAEGNSLHPLQRGLLRRGFELLEPGGRLVYSTCSLNPIENEAVVAAFLSETSNAELLSWDPLKVESFQEGVTEWMVPESDFETSRLMHKSYDAPQLPKSQATLFPPKNELLQASLRRCRRLVPLSLEAHHGGFFVAVVTKSKGPKSPNPSAAQEWEPVEVEADLEQKVKKHPMRRLFQPVPVERWAALQAYWSLDLPVERLSANRLGQLVLATRTLAACCVSRKVDLPIVEGGLALFPAEGLKPFDEAVSFLSGYTPRKKQLTLMEFLEMVKAEQKEEEEEEEDLHIFTLEAVTEPCKRVFAVLGATQNGRAWCVASPRYRQVLLEVLREIVKTRDVQQSKEDAALSC